MSNDNETQENKAIDDVKEDLLAKVDQGSKAVENDVKEKKTVKKREVTSTKKLKSIDQEKLELEKRLLEIKKEKKSNELEYYQRLYFLIGKAVWEDLEDTKKIDATEYSEQLVKLKKVLASKIKAKKDKELLAFKDFIEHP